MKPRSISIRCGLSAFYGYTLLGKCLCRRINPIPIFDNHLSNVIPNKFRTDRTDNDIYSPEPTSHRCMTRREHVYIADHILLESTSFTSYRWKFIYTRKFLGTQASGMGEVTRRIPG